MLKHTARADRRGLLDTVLVLAILIFGTGGLVWYATRCDCCHGSKHQTVVPMDPIHKQSKLPKIEHAPAPFWHRIVP
jgi:hypothetical protein